MNWPVWANDPAAIIASGPSTGRAAFDLDKLRGGFRVLAIGENINLCPWADVCYSCDGNWWHHRKGLPEFNGWKITNDGPAASRFGLRKVTVRANIDRLLFGEIGMIGGGGCSGFQALNLVMQFKANRIILVGFDMNDNDKHEAVHWYGRNNWPGSHNPSRRDFVRWRHALDSARYDKRIIVINASERSSLHSYPKMTLDAAIECTRPS